VTIRLATPARAARQGRWIAAMEPWRGLGYGAAGLGRYLARAARAGEVLIAEAARGPARAVGRGRARAGARPGARAETAALLVLQPNVLLGSFVALLAVRPEAAGRGLGTGLVAAAEARTFTSRRWLYVSADAGNAGALRFYRKLGFRRVAVLPDMVRAGRTEVLLRKGAPASARAS
jgi:ribosomal protein S18 acetylase RimI-like enzyme